VRLGLEPAQLIGVLEDDPGDALAIDGALGGDFGAPALDQLLAHVIAVEQVVRDATDLTASVSPWLQADHDNLSGKVLKLPDRSDIDTPVAEQLIVELYSK
jgi:ribosomal protein S4